MSRLFRAPRVFLDEGYQADRWIRVEGGRIRAVLESPPQDQDALELPGTVIPGLIDAHCHIGLLEEMETGGDGANEKAHPVAPQLRVRDGVNPADPQFAQALAGGITAVGILPGSSCVIGGQAAVYRTAGPSGTAELLEPYAGLKAALGENPCRDFGRQGQAPFTRMGTAALLRQALAGAQGHRDLPAGRAPRDLAREALVPVLAGTVPLRVHAHRADDMGTALEIAREFGLQLVLDHCTGGARRMEEIRAQGARLTVGPLWQARSKRELEDLDPRLPARLEAAGLRFALVSDAPELPAGSLRLLAMMAHRDGLSEAGALRAVTSEAARVLGVDGRMGRIAPGQEATFAVFGGDPLDFYAPLRAVYILGERVWHG